MLAGGHHRRFGPDKALARLGDRTLLEWAVGSLEAVVPRVWLAGADRLAYDFVGLPTLRDERPGGGPLAALVAGLRFGRPLLVLAVDLFPAHPEVWHTLWQAAETADAALVLTDRPQYLFGVYRPCCLPAAEAELVGERRLEGFVARLKAVSVRLTPGPINVNRPEDLAEVARRWFGDAAQSGHRRGGGYGPGA